jgi:hypothetical protein
MSMSDHAWPSLKLAASPRSLNQGSFRLVTRATVAKQMPPSWLPHLCPRDRLVSRVVFCKNNRSRDSIHRKVMTTLKSAQQVA